MDILAVSTVKSWGNSSSAREAGYPATHAFDGISIVCGRSFDFQITGGLQDVNCNVCKKKLEKIGIKIFQTLIRRKRRKKHQPIKPGEYGDGSFNAILSPDGKFYRAKTWEHHRVAYGVTGEDWAELRPK